MITRLFAVFNKEWRLLWRDKVGLIFLFLLPMCLVLFITLTSSVSPTEQRKIHLLLINQDPTGEFTKGVITGLSKIDSFEISTTLHKKPIDFNKAKKAVAVGDYQGVIIIPPNLSQQINTKIQQQTQPGNTASPLPAAEIKVWYDPAIPKNFQSQVTSALQLLTQSIELQLWRQLINKLTYHQQPSAGQSNLVRINTDYIQTTSTPGQAQPNEVQQNVPAWALFGMFFIITPLSGVIVKERKLGVMDRLWIAPVSLNLLIWGKILAFVCVNLLQLILMLAVGVFILPWFGFPKLNVTSHPGSLFIIGLAASLAATGFGMLIGSLVKTPEQASVIGPFIIVILASIGGIFVPPYLLPESLKHMTQYSPMFWALQSFIDIFVRNASLIELLPNILKLLCFALVTITLASVILKFYRR